MIIVKLKGGLGNQMFQYAFAKSIEKASSKLISLDLSFYESSQKEVTPRKFELNVFKINLNTNAIPTKKNYKDNILQRIKSRFFSRRNIYIEKNFNFNPCLLDKRNVYLIYDGYFQSEKYFKDIREIILEEFTLKVEISKETRLALEVLNNKNSISVHVRRGDFISSAANRNFHGSCDLSYYQSAIELIKTKVSDPYFVFFSDDMEWVKSNFKNYDNILYIEHNKESRSYEDMFLMSCCKHNIIANSSFSWWGAWLNKNPDKIVIAPSIWFRDSSVDTRDIVPKDWIKL